VSYRYEPNDLLVACPPCPPCPEKGGFLERLTALTNAVRPIVKEVAPILLTIAPLFVTPAPRRRSHRRRR
jgi:hypothetical protein